jgi:hypothetical protein
MTFVPITSKNSALDWIVLEQWTLAVCIKNRKGGLGLKI